METNEAKANNKAPPKKNGRKRADRPVYRSRRNRAQEKKAKENVTFIPVGKDVDQVQKVPDSRDTEQTDAQRRRREKEQKRRERRRERKKAARQQEKKQAQASTPATSAPPVKSKAIVKVSPEERAEYNRSTYEPRKTPDCEVVKEESNKKKKRRRPKNRRKENVNEFSGTSRSQFSPRRSDVAPVPPKTKTMNASKMFELFRSHEKERGPDSSPGHTNNDLDEVFRAARDLMEKSEKERSFSLEQQVQQVRLEQQAVKVSETTRSRASKKTAALPEHVRMYRLSKELDSDINSPSADSSRRSKCRLEQRDIYVQLIAHHLGFSVEKSVPAKLWMMYYRRIQERIKKFRELKPPDERIERSRERVRHIIDEASSVFSSIAEGLEQKAGSSEVDVTTSPHVQAVLSTLITCLGDLARYEQQIALEQDWTPAETYYLRALSFDCGHGKVHNQLAEIARQRLLVAQDADQVSVLEFEAIYRYTFSLHATRPFPAKANLQAQCERNRLRILQLETQCAHGERALGMLLPRFVRLYSILTSRISVETFDQLLSSTLHVFQLHLLANTLTDALLCRILLLCVSLFEQSMVNDMKRTSGSTPSLLTNKAATLFFRLFGLVARWTASQLQLPFLGTFAIACCWLMQEKCSFLFMQENFDAADFFRIGLAHLVNALQAGESKTTEDPQTSAALHSLFGFVPLEQLPRFRSGDLDRDWQIETIVEAGHDFLYFHENLDRFSAFATAPIQAVDAQEHAEIRKTLDQKFRANSQRSKRRRNKSKSKVKEQEDSELTVKTSNSDTDSESTESDSNSGSESRTDEYSSGYKSAGIADALLSSEDELDSFEQDVILFRPGAAAGVLGVDIRAWSEARAQQKKADMARVEQERLAAAQKTKQQASKRETDTLLVLDAPNISMRHGNHTLFSTSGLSLVIDYYRQKGHAVLAFVPECYLDYDYVANKKRELKVGFDVRAAQMPDNVSHLRALRDEGLLSTTPSQDYDDSYCIEYALRHNACIVSNDKYRDYIEKVAPQERATMRRWLKTHLISFAFVGHEFIPNPDFVFPTD
jgi:hypothetical protein